MRSSRAYSADAPACANTSTTPLKRTVQRRVQGDLRQGGGQWEGSREVKGPGPGSAGSALKAQARRHSAARQGCTRAQRRAAPAAPFPAMNESDAHVAPELPLQLLCPRLALGGGGTLAALAGAAARRLLQGRVGHRRVLSSGRRSRAASCKHAAPAADPASPPRPRGSTGQGRPSPPQPLHARAATPCTTHPQPSTCACCHASHTPCPVRPP